MLLNIGNSRLIFCSMFTVYITTEGKFVMSIIEQNKKIINGILETFDKI